MSNEIKLTEGQKNAVYSKGHTLLVSAAAGSGKTAVLTKRIINIITDDKDPTDVSDLLVVTYTKAAASELKERISKAIYEAMQENPGNKHLSKQLIMLGGAKICTIHSFCFDLVRKNFQILGLSNTVKIGEEGEILLVANNVLNTLIEECYSGLHTEITPHFDEFSESFLMGKTDDNLAVDFLDIYNSLRNYPQGIEVLKSAAEELAESAEDNILHSKWGNVIRRYLKKVYEYHYSKLNTSCKEIECDEYLSMNYLEAFQKDATFCYKVCDLLDNGTYSDVFDLFSSFKYKELGTKGKNKPESAEYHKKIRDRFKSVNNKIKTEMFCFSEKNVRQHFKLTSEINDTLYRFFGIFESRFFEEKAKRGILDYNDLERLSLKLLYNDTALTEKSNIAYSVQERFKHVFIDEYQDVNELQDKIFSAVSTPKNRFMVGDIKQSIYGFRGSEPSLFSSYRNAFPMYSSDEDKSDGLTVFLSDNFRSHKTVLDYSNAVFSLLFNNNSGEMPYTKGDELRCSRIYKEDDVDEKVRMCYMKDEAGVKGYIKEAEFVAREVESLIKNGHKPSEIALLFRYKTKTVFFEEALRRRNIPTFNKENKDFFENDAVLLMLCLLNAIDNPTRDIYLAGLVKSPIFNFSMTELTVIREAEKYGSLYDAIKRYGKNNNSKKCIDFIDKLNEWRKYAEGCPVDKLIKYIYNETHIVELLSSKATEDQSAERQANLLLLYEYAMRFENGSFKGLYNFILYLNEILDRNTKLANAKVTADGDGVVKIMSVHNSKGLEFDTVYFCDTACKLNRTDEKNYYIVSKELGLTMKLRDATTFGRFDPFVRVASKYQSRERSVDEELRVIYVALTRAKKRLIITSALKNSEKYIDSIKDDPFDLTHYDLLEADKPTHFITPAIFKSNYIDNVSVEYIGELTDVSSDIESECESDVNDVVPALDQAEIDRLSEILLKENRLDSRYKYDIFTTLPTKLSVSKLYPGILDEYASEVNTSIPTMYSKPKFLSDEEKKATGAEKGTATHVFMQFCDFDNVVNRGAQNELSSLVDKGYIDSRNAKLVDIETVEKFFKSNIFESIKKSKNIWREKRFTVKMPISEFLEDDGGKNLTTNEKILVQGVIDLLFETNDGRLILADYKTDHFSKKAIASGEAEQVLIERHKTQLQYYAKACDMFLGKKVDEIYIYSFALDKEIKIN